MKRLALFRHAKTEADSETGRDFDRRLTERGERDARRIGQEIAALGKFHLILCSPAARARQTAELAGLTPLFDERIYNASAGQLLAIVQEAGAEADSLLMIGHNPGFEQLASMLSGVPVDMATGTFVVIELPVDHWHDVGSELGRLVSVLRPKEL